MSDKKRYYFSRLLNCFVFSILFAFCFEVKTEQISAEDINNLSEQNNLTDLAKIKQPTFIWTNQFPTDGSDLLFENLVIEFAKYAVNHKPLFELFYQLAKNQNSIDYAILAFNQASMLQDQTAIKQASQLWLNLSKNDDDKMKYYYSLIVVSIANGHLDKAKEYLVEITNITNNKLATFNELVVAFHHSFRQNGDKNYLALIEYIIPYLDEADKAEAYLSTSQIAYTWGIEQKAYDFSKLALQLSNDFKYKNYHLTLLASQKKYAQLISFFDHNFTKEDYANIDPGIFTIYLINVSNQKRFDYHFVDLMEYLSTNNLDEVVHRYVFSLYYIEKNEIEKAKDLLEQVVKEQSYVKNSAYFNLATVYNLLSQFEKALEVYQLITDSQYKDQVIFFSNLIKGAYFDNPQASEVLKEIYQANHDIFINTISQLVIAYQSHNKSNIAKKYLDYILANFKDRQISIEIGLMQSNILYQMKDYQAFELLVYDLYDRYQDDPFVLNTLGYYLLSDKKDIQSARPLILKAFELKPSDAAIIDSLGWLYFQEKKYQQAFDLISKSYALEPHPEILAHLIEVLFALDQKEQARVLLNKALEKFPDDNFLLNIKDRIL